MLVKELLERLFATFDPAWAEDWDHVGLSVGRLSDEVTGVACALDVTDENLRAARDAGANVLLTHHPVYIKAPGGFVPDDPALPACAGAVHTAASLGMSVISLHTNLDRSREARAKLPGLLGMEPVSSLEHPGDPEAPGLGAVCDGEPQTLARLAGRAADAFGCEPRVWGAPDRPLSRVAFLGGSLGSFGEHALAAGCDAVVCGEAGYHVVQDLAIRGLAVVLLGHDRSEEPFVEILRDAAVSSGIDARSVRIMSRPHQWWTAQRTEQEHS